MSESCDIAIEAYHDGELSASQRLEVQEHLAGCDACAARLAELRRMSALLKEASGEKLSRIGQERLELGVREMIRRNREERREMRMAWRWAAAAACVALAGSAWLSRTGGSRLEAAPPWVEIAAASDADPAVRQADSPVAQWYLASASGQDDAGPSR